MNPVNATPPLDAGLNQKFTLGLTSTIIATVVSGIVGFLTTGFHGMEQAQQRLGVLESQRQGDAARLQRIEDKLDRLVEQAALGQPAAKPGRPHGSFRGPGRSAGLELAAAFLRPGPPWPLPFTHERYADDAVPETPAPGPRHRPGAAGGRLSLDW